MRFDSDKLDEEDTLERSLLCENLALSILNYRENESLSIGLIGEWGSGKSWVVAKTCSHLQNFAESERPIVVDFKPWNYSNSDQLIEQFFIQLTSSLKISDWNDIPKKVEITKNLSDYARSLVPPLVTLTNQANPLIAWIFVGISLYLASVHNYFFKKNLTKLEDKKEKINSVLLKSSKKIVVIIDDIDRCNDTEILQIFQLVKSIADFKNTIYLLSFDKEVVCKALKKSNDFSGEHYLEKIVQVPINLPMPDQELIDRLLQAELKTILDEETYEDSNNNQYFQEVYSIVRQFYKNPRDIKRFRNTFSFAYNSIKDEIYYVDFIALTTIQVFADSVYKKIYEYNDDYFLLFNSRYSPPNTDERRKLFDEYNELLAKLIEGAAFNNRLIQSLLRKILPQREIHNGRPIEDIHSRRLKRMISSRDFFYRYFYLHVPVKDISVREVERILVDAKEISNFESDLKKLVIDDKLMPFLLRFRDFDSHTISNEAAKNIIKCLIVENSIPNAFKKIDVPQAIWFLIVSQFNSYEDRLNVIQATANNSELCIDLILEIIHSCWLTKDEMINYVSVGMSQDNAIAKCKPFLYEDGHIENLQNLVCKQIAQAAKEQKLNVYERKRHIFYSWEKYSSNKELQKKFIDNFILEDKNFIEFLTWDINPKPDSDFKHRSTDYRSIEQIQNRLNEIKASEGYEEKYNFEEKQTIHQWLQSN